MGEIIKKYGEIKFNNSSVDVELNGPIDDMSGGIIHLQNEKFRLEFSQLDFYDVFATINMAYAQLKSYKGGKLDE